MIPTITIIHVSRTQLLLRIDLPKATVWKYQAAREQDPIDIAVVANGICHISDEATKIMRDEIASYYSSVGLGTLLSMSHPQAHLSKIYDAQ